MTTEHTTTKGLVLLGVLALVVAAVIGATALTASAQDNDVEFEGEVVVSGDPVTDGKTLDYDLTDIDEASNLSIALEGRISEQSASESGSGSGALDVGGSLDPVGPGDHSEPQLTVTENGPQTAGVPDNPGPHDGSSDFFGDGGEESESLIRNPPDVVEEIKFNITNVYNGGAEGIEIYIDNGAPNGDPTSGTNVKTYNHDGSTGVQTIDISNFETTGDEITIGVWSPDLNKNAGNYITAQIGTWETSSTGDAHYHTEYDSYQSADIWVSGSVSATATDDQGASSEISLATGSSETMGIDLSKDSSSIGFGDGNANIDWTLEYVERVESVNPSLEINGHTTSYDGTLSDGETATIEASDSWLVDGKNRINVSVADSVGGPDAAVAVDYRHDAATDKKVGYSGEAWSERYNVTRTFANTQSGVDLTIPFESSRVVSIRDVQILSDGSWRPATESEYSLNGTTLSTDVGDVDAGETVGVRANGTKVDVQTGTIEVTDPTIEGDDLSTGIEVVDGSDGLEIEVGGTVSGDLLHYLGESSWSSNDRSVLDGDGQLFRMPEAPTGGTATVATAPLDIDTEGDAVVLVDDAEEPRFTLRPGDSSDDTVSIRYLDTESGETYDLIDAESEAVVDRNTASSPVLLETTDAERTYLIEQFTGGTAGGGSGGGGGGGALGPIPADQNPTPWTSLGIPLGILAIAAGVVIIFLARVRYGSSDDESTADTSGPLEYVASILGRAGRWVVARPMAGGALLALAALGVLSTGTVGVPEGTVPALFTVGAPLASYVGLNRTGRFDWMVWGLTTGVAVVVGLVWMGVDLFGQLINSQVALIVAIGGLYLVYRGIKSYQKGKTTNITIAGNEGDGS